MNTKILHSNFNYRNWIEEL